MMVAPSEGLDRSMLERSRLRHGTILADRSEHVWPKISKRLVFSSASSHAHHYKEAMGGFWPVR
jgi:hypothetical protein